MSWIRGSHKIAHLGQILMGPLMSAWSIKPGKFALAALASLDHGARVHPERQFPRVILIRVIDEVQGCPDLGAMMVRLRDRLKAASEKESGHDTLENSPVIEEAMVQHHGPRERQMSG